MDLIELDSVGNQTQVYEVGNHVEVKLFDVFTDRYFISQFQIAEEHREVTHANND